MVTSPMRRAATSPRPLSMPSNSSSHSRVLRAKSRPPAGGGARGGGGGGGGAAGGSGLEVVEGGVEVGRRQVDGFGRSAEALQLGHGGESLYVGQIAFVRHGVALLLSPVHSRPLKSHQ